MKKIIAMGLSIVFSLAFFTSCSLVSILKPKTEVVPEVEEPVYSKEHMGVWYGFDAQSNEASLEIKLLEQDSKTVYATIKDYGDTSNTSLENFEITFYSENHAKEEGNPSLQRVFNFYVNDEGKDVLELLFLNPSTKKQIQPAVVCGRASERGAALGKAIPTEPPVPEEKIRFLQRYDILSQQEILGDTQMDMNISSSELFRAWDVLLNDIFQYLKQTKPSDEFQKIQEDELDWIVEKEAAIEATQNEYAGGSIMPLMANCTAIDYTKQRCHYLISLID